LIETFSAKQNKKQNKTSISAKANGKLNALALKNVYSENAGV